MQTNLAGNVFMQTNLAGNVFMQTNSAGSHLYKKQGWSTLTTPVLFSGNTVLFLLFLGQRKAVQLFHCLGFQLLQ